MNTINAMAKLNSAGFKVLSVDERTVQVSAEPEKNNFTVLNLLNWCSIHHVMMRRDGKICTVFC
jgi:hypothetical protein